MEKVKNVSVIGLGKLGAPLAAVLASKGFNVIGLDLNPAFVSSLNNAKAPVEEPQLQQFITEHKDRLRATTDYNDAILNSDVTFVIVPTPSVDNGLFSNQYVLQSVRAIGHALQNKSGYHLVVITSTVMPGTTNNEIKAELEAASQRQVGKELGLCYNPEFIALGSVVKNMLWPDMILLGESDPKAGNILESIYKVVCNNNPPIMRMNLTNAEITKIAVNTYVTTKISFANMLSDVCDRLADADVDVVTQAMGLDSRIGQKYLKGATGYGGPCFPRDNIAFTALAHKLGARADIAEATDAINDYQLQRILPLIEQYGKSKKIGILGLSYKPHTAVIEESIGIALANSLAESGHQVSVYDPMAIPAARKVLHSDVGAKDSLQECVAESDIIVITTDWPEFHEQLNPALLQRTPSRRIIIDCWRTLSEAQISPVAELHYMGYGKKQKLTQHTLVSSAEDVVEDIFEASLSKVEQSA